MTGSIQWVSRFFYYLEGFHVAVGGVEVGDGALGCVGEYLLELADGFLGHHEFYGHLHLVVNEDDDLAECVDLRDVGDVDDEASADALEVDVADGLGYLDEVLEACQEGESSTALELQGDVVAIADGVHYVVKTYLGKFVTGDEVDVVLFCAHKYDLVSVIDAFSCFASAKLVI